MTDEPYSTHADYSSHLGFFKGEEVVLRGDTLRGLITRITPSTIWVLWDNESKASAMCPDDVLPYEGPETQREFPARFKQGPPIRRGE